MIKSIIEQNSIPNYYSMHRSHLEEELAAESIVVYSHDGGGSKTVCVQEQEGFLPTRRKIEGRLDASRSMLGMTLPLIN